jgi:NitT/TauT family transport system substrate-binding protein
MNLRRLGALSVIFCIVACMPDNGQSGMKRVRVSGRAFFSNAPLYIADEEGFFAREGIALEFATVSNSSTQAIPALENGQLDVLAAGITPGLFNAIAGGARLRIVADKVHIDSRGCSYSAVLGNKARFKSANLKAEDVRGGRMAVSAAAVAGYTADAYLRSLGLDLSDVQIVTIPETAGPQALESGSIDFLVATEPWLTQLKGKSTYLASANTLVPGLQLAAIVFGPSLIVNDRETGKRFLRAYLRGVRQMQNGPTARNLDILSRRMELDSTVLGSACWPSIRNDGEVDTVSLKQFQDWARDAGNLKTQVSPSQYLDKALLTDALLKH